MQDADFDAGDRVVAQSTGAQTLELTGTSQESKVFISYTDRGTVKQVTSSFGILVDHVYRDADGLVTQIEYGDVAKTTTDFTYDNRRRVKTVQTHRGPPASWTTPSTNYLPAPTYGTDPTTSFQLILQDDEFSYDAVDNPVEIRDWRDPAEWPTSAKPVTRKMQYDDLNRVTQIEYQYPTATGKDPWKSPFTADFEAGNEDPRMAKPSPHQVFDNRPLVQSFAFDWLGNTTKTDDDAHGFYDRSLGKITNNSEENKPYQLVSAKQSAGDHTGNLQAAYDDAGNLIDLAVMRHGQCFPTGADCSQRFVYKWDEVGRLVQARRWDISTPQVLDPEPKQAPAADLSYRYDASDSRVLKTARDDQGEIVHSVYIFGSLELRRARFLEPDAVGAVPDYELSTQTEVGYLFAHGVRLARLHWDADGSPAVGGANLHVLFELGDHLGSSSKVLDKATSELVEASTYMGYGQAESDYRPGRWNSFREDYRFTGKEEDSEVGLTYFGKRFLSSQLKRWVSADPLIVHEQSKSVRFLGDARTQEVQSNDFSSREKRGDKHGSIDGVDTTQPNASSRKDSSKKIVVDANLYAYVSGQLLRVVDVEGLQGTSANASSGSNQNSSTSSSFDRNVISSTLESLVVGAAGAAIGALFWGKFLGRWGAKAGKWGATVGGTIAGINGLVSGARGTYDWFGSNGALSAAEGWMGFALDSTWSAPNTVIGLISMVGQLPNGEYDHGNSLRSNAHFYKHGIASGFYTTLGHVVNGNAKDKKKYHEKIHVWQGRIFGSLYYPTYLTFSTVLGIWSLLDTWGGVYAVNPPNAKSNLKKFAYRRNPFELWAYGQAGD